MTDGSVARARAEWLFWVAPLAFTALVYHSVVRNYFFADDFLNLYHIATKPLLEYLLTPNGGHLLVARNAIFYLMARSVGTEPAYYYWSGLLTHLLNVYLLFRLLRLVTDGPWLASFGAALWGGSPFLSEALTWYAVYGHILVGTALLVILCQATNDAAKGIPPPQAQTRLWYALALSAATSFGTGIGIAMALPLALGVLLPVRSRRLPPLASLLIVVPLGYVLLTLAYEHLSGQQVVSGAAFSTIIADKLLLANFLVRFIGIGLTRLVLGSYFPPWANLSVWYASCVLLAVIVALTVSVSPPRVRRQLVAWSLLLVACYGSIAVGRAYLLSKLPVDAVSKLSRYHYVGQLLLTIILCTVLARFPHPRRMWMKTALLLAWFTVALSMWARYGEPLDHRDDAREQTAQALTEIRTAIAAQSPGETVRIPNRVFDPLPLPPVMFPGWAAAFTIFFPDNVVDGRQVVFVESNPGVVQAMQHHGRMGTLLVPP